MDPIWWAKVQRRRDTAGPVVSIVWSEMPTDETFRERVERAIHHGARAAGAKGRVTLECPAGHGNVIRVVDADVEIPSQDFPVAAEPGTAEGWLGVAGIVTA